jgi:hypothetical protein
VREDGETGQIIARAHMGIDTKHWVDLISTVEETADENRLIQIITDLGIVSIPSNLLLLND